MRKKLCYAQRRKVAGLWPTRKASYTKQLLRWSLAKLNLQDSLTVTNDTVNIIAVTNGADKSGGK